MLTCYAKCVHREGDTCGLLNHGHPIVLDPRGYCTMKEEPVAHNTPVRLCTHNACRNEATTFCRKCNRPLCEEPGHVYDHRGWRQHLCILCWARHAPSIKAEDLADEEFWI